MNDRDSPPVYASGVRLDWSGVDAPLPVRSVRSVVVAVVSVFR